MERLRIMVNALPDMVILKDGRGRWLEVNEAALRFFQLEKVGYRGKRASEICDPQNIFHEMLLACQDTDEQTWRAAETRNFERVVLKPDGTFQFFSVVKTPVFHPDGGRKGIVAIWRDITESKLAGDKLQLAEEMFENLTEGVMITDERGIIQSINPAFTIITGYSPEEVVGKTPRLLKSGRHEGSFYQTMWASIRETGQWKGEIWNRRKNGEIYAENLTINAIKDSSDNVTFYIGVFSDITERKRLEKDVILTGTIQRKFLPQDIADERITLKTIYRPAYYLSGDSYEFRWNKNRNVLIGCVIDVMGHGLAPALQNSALKVLFNEAAERNMPLDKKLAWMNRKSMSYFVEDSFAAVICFEIDFSQKTLTCVAGGINHFLVLSSQNQRVMKLPGTFVGLFEDVEYERHVFPYRSGDSFFFMSDGLLDLLPVQNDQRFTDFSASVSMLEQLSKRASDDATAVCIKLA
ncbi:PAS domain S-box protein [Effusibacillus lacus]|nr:PAS domain S-box protein [Effusibacillus lacus]